MLIGQGELDLLGLGTALRNVENLEGDELAGVVVVEDHPGLLFVALGDLGPLPKHDGEGVSVLVVLNLHVFMPSSTWRSEWSSCLSRSPLAGVGCPRIHG